MLLIHFAAHHLQIGHLAQKGVFLDDVQHREQPLQVAVDTLARKGHQSGQAQLSAQVPHDHGLVEALVALADSARIHPQELAQVGLGEAPSDGLRSRRLPVLRVGPLRVAREQLGHLEQLGVAGESQELEQVGLLCVSGGEDGLFGQRVAKGPSEGVQLRLEVGPFPVRLHRRLEQVRLLVESLLRVPESPVQSRQALAQLRIETRLPLRQAHDPFPEVLVGQVVVSVRQSDPRVHVAPGLRVALRVVLGLHIFLEPK